MSSANLFQIVAAESGAKLVNKDELIELRHLQAEWQKASDTAKDCGVDNAYCAFIGEREKLTKAVRSGEIHDFHPRSREEWEEIFLRRGDAAKEALRQLCREAVPLARKVAEKFSEAAKDVITAIEKQ